MSEVSISMSVPLDSAGFLRRACPTCERQFKWYPGQGDGDGSTLAVAAPEVYHCPYCSAPAQLDAWWTQEQLIYAQELAAAEIVRPMLGNFGADMQQLNQPDSLMTFDVAIPDMPSPAPLTESDDMVRVDFPCHPEEPLKVDDAWTDDVACLVCGIRYPLALVRELPDVDAGSQP